MPRLMRTVARTAVVAGTATAVSGRVARRQQGRWDQQADAEAYREMQQAPPPPPQAYQTPAPAAPQVDTVAQLKELAQLKEAGVLTEDEFAAQKAKILG